MIGETVGLVKFYEYVIKTSGLMQVFFFFKYFSFRSNLE